MTWPFLYAFITGFLFSLSLNFDLGIVNVAAIKAGMEKGFKPSFLLGFGSCFGDLFYLTLALLGMTVIFEFTWVKWVLWIGGTVILLYLALRMLKDTIKPKPIDAANVQSGSEKAWKNIVFGAGLTLSSPTVIIWFAVVAGPIVAGLHLDKPAILFIFIIGFFTAGLLWSLVIAAVSSSTGKRLGTRFVRGLSLISALLFLFFAGKVFIDGIALVTRG
ncbi:LysE family translocator [Paenibacillus abyssi]|nr:LysE family transporter [Paenibacillus abyssi]